MNDFTTPTGLPTEDNLPKNESLWQRVLADDQDAFQEVVERYQSRISAVAYSITGNFTWAQEITQETFWQAWRSRAELSDPARLGAWLAGIARNLSYQLLKQEKRQPFNRQVTETWPDHVNRFQSIDLGSDASDPALVHVSHEESEAVWTALKKLPDNFREPLILFYREEHSIADVADVLSISQDAVKQRLSRGRNLLRERLAEQVEDVLVRTRPNRVLTTRIMAGVAALATSMKATGSAVAATTASGVAASSVTGAFATGAAATVSKHVVGSVATKSLLASPFAGGLLGIAGGLGGAWLGIWLPAQMAPTVAQRELLQRRGRISFLVAVIFTFVLLAASGLLFLPISPIWCALTTAIASLAFVFFIVMQTIETNRLLEELKQDDTSAKNDSQWKQRLEVLQVKQGRSFTSRMTFLGLPLLDVQLGGDPSCSSPRRKAKGWIAIGDQATGFIALGGVAKGVVAIGGVAIGLVAFGGAAFGGLAFGGAAIGGLAIGGAAIGYDAAGGGAVGIHSAVGGGAIAYRVAVGGAAWAAEYSVSGTSVHSPDNPAWVVAQQESYIGLLKYLSSPWVTTFVCVGAVLLSLVMALGVRYLPDNGQAFEDKLGNHSE